MLLLNIQHITKVRFMLVFCLVVRITPVSFLRYLTLFQHPNSLNICCFCSLVRLLDNSTSHDYSY